MRIVSVELVRMLRGDVERLKITVNTLQTQVDALMGSAAVAVVPKLPWSVVDSGTFIDVYGATDAQIAYGMQQLDPEGGWTVERIHANRKKAPAQGWCIPCHWRPGVTLASITKLMQDAPRD